MKLLNLIKTVFILLGICLSFGLHAQRIINECATPYNFPDPLRNVPASQLLQSPAAGITMMKMYVHICRNDDGSNQAMTSQQVENEIRTTDSVYKLGNVCFALAGLDYLNNSSLNNDIRNTNVSPFLVPNCFTVFVVKLIPTAVGTIFGTAFAIPNNYIAIVPAGFGPRQTFIHELGHDLGLFHTFHGQPFESGTGLCAELVNGSNATSCGDLVSDTPADPYDDGTNTSCNSVSGTCVWNGTCKDANNQLYSPDTHNFMGYWPNAAAACDRNDFSSGQFTRMQNTITNTPILQNTVAPASLNVFNSSTSSGYVAVAAQNLVNAGNLIFNGDYNLTGSVKAYITSALVVLKPGFLAQPNSTGEVRILPTICQ